MTFPRMVNHLPSTLLLCLLALPQSHALTVGNKAAIGIGTGFGFFLCATIAGFCFLYFYKRKTRRLARERGGVEMAPQPKLTSKQLIELHAKENPKNFDISKYTA
jgi:hypothetical protein